MPRGGKRMGAGRPKSGSVLSTGTTVVGQIEGMR